MFNINTRSPRGVAILFMGALLLQCCGGGQVLGSKTRKASPHEVAPMSTPSDSSVKKPLADRSSKSASSSSTLLQRCGGGQVLGSETRKVSFHELAPISTPFDPSVKKPLVNRSSKPVSSSSTLQIPVEVPPNKIHTETVLRTDLRGLVFGKQAWQDHFKVHVGKEPPLPPEINNILDSPCPFWRGRTVKDTHLLVLIPATVNGERCTLNKLGKLIENLEAKIAYNDGCYGNDPNVQEECGNTPLPEKIPYWLLMTRDVLPGSRNKSYAEQQEMVNQYRSHNYRLPYGLEAVMCILAHYERNGCHLFGHKPWGDEPWTYMRCTPQHLAGGYCPLVVGGFNSSGLEIALDLDANSTERNLGVACCRKLQ